MWNLNSKTFQFVSNKVICKVTLSFTPLFPLWGASAKWWNFIKISVWKQKLSIQCTRFESNYSSCTGRISENICSVAAVEALRKKERGDETQFTTKIGWKKLVWVPVISFCKISFPVRHLMAYYAEMAVLGPLIVYIIYL